MRQVFKGPWGLPMEVITEVRSTNMAPWGKSTEKQELKNTDNKTKPKITQAKP